MPCCLSQVPVHAGVAVLPDGPEQAQGVPILRPQRKPGIYHSTREFLQSHTRIPYKACFCAAFPTLFL